MEDHISFGKRMTRALRRAFYENTSKRARLKAERQFEEQNQRRMIRHYTVEDFYQRLIKNDGHWMDGGCSKARCGLCQPREIQHRYAKELERLDSERREELG